MRQRPSYVLSQEKKPALPKERIPARGQGAQGLVPELSQHNLGATALTVGLCGVFDANSRTSGESVLFTGVGESDDTPPSSPPTAEVGQSAQSPGAWLPTTGRWQRENL